MPEPRPSGRPRRAAAHRSLGLSPRHRAQRRAQQAAAQEPEPLQPETPQLQTPDQEPSAPAENLQDGSVAEASNPDRSQQDQSPPAPDARRGLWHSLASPGRGQLIAAVILFVVGLGGVMQVRINNADDTYTNARREDLVQLLDGLGSESRRLEGEIADLERTKTSLQSGADTQRVAREEAEKRVEVLSLLAGTVPAEGPGIRLRIADPSGKVDADVILDAVEEMRDAGAEVIEVNNAIRVVASSWFATGPDGLLIDDSPVSNPITIEVIGDPHSLEEAARFRGGIVSEITGPTIGGQVQIEQLDRVVVESLHSPVPNQYAQPASPPPTPR
ncbi:MAG: hypothetical protein QOF52_2620 [Propionibacteriaceae bacterium]|nr:hypothetical protein [Propionibacteriaceae bacterium]